MSNIVLHVIRDGQTFGVYRQPAADGTGQELLEGGFFSKGAAVEAKGRWAHALTTRDEHVFEPSGVDYPNFLYCRHCGASETEHRQ
jgi:hypothetical protein